MKKMLLAIALVAILPLTTWAAPFIMEGDYVRTAVSDNGTLGFGSGTAPGLLHDASGTSTFTTDDYLTPGSPWEIFAVSSSETGNLVNNNTSPSSGGITGSILSTTSSSYDNYVLWEGFSSGYFDFTLETFFNDGDERVSFTTTITATHDLTDLTFLRAIDPDQDVISGHTHDTTNNRGYDANSDGDFDDAGDLAPEDWVSSEGNVTGLTLGLYTDSVYTHNTSIDNAWSSLAATYLAGEDDGDGDWTIGLGFDLGTLLAGQSITLDYAYVMGDSLASVDLPDDDTAPVPEPSTWILMGTGLAGLAWYRRRKSA